MKLEITKEKVLEAAAKCSTAKEILETLFPEVFDVVIMHKFGERFRGGLLGQDYILAKCGAGIAGLINLQTGVLWNGPVTVKSFNGVTKDEFSLIADCGSFTKI